MNVHVSYKVHKTPDIEKEISHQIEKVQKRLQVFRPELVHLKAVIDENSAREGTLAALNLRLPSGQLTAQAKAPSATAAIKAAFDELIQQIGRHKELLRSSHKWRRWRGGAQESAEPGVPFEQTLAAVLPPTISADDIGCYVNANLGRLERFVDRELYFRRAADEIAISEDDLSTAEVVNEVIARALGDHDRPEKLTLEPWLYRLAGTGFCGSSGRQQPPAECRSLGRSRIAVPSARRGLDARERHSRSPRVHSGTGHLFRRSDCPGASRTRRRRTHRS